MKYLDPETFRNEGYLQEANRLFFHPLGLALEVNTETGVIKVWDYRDDPEGIRFEELDRRKSDRVRFLAEERAEARREALGYWVQPT